MRAIVLGAALLALAGCAANDLATFVNGHDTEAADNERCLQWGTKPGSSEYVQCRAVMAQNRREAQRDATAQRNALMYPYSAPPAPAAPYGGGGNGGVCMKQSEYMSGMNRVCNYNCMGSTYAQTIGSTQLCPLSIQR